VKAWTRLDSLILAIFAALVLLFHWRILTPDLADRQSFPPGDFTAQFWAFTTFEVRELAAGRLPLWNPYTYAGVPFWADVQSAVFYPPSLLTLLLSAPWGFSLFALEVEAIAHFWLAAAFMYLFAREVTTSRPAGVIAAFTFTFSGYLTGYPGQQLAVLETDVWLPLILFFLHRANERRKVGVESWSWRKNLLSNSLLQLPTLYTLLAGAALGMALLAGHPQSAHITLYISVAYFIFLWVGRASLTPNPLPAVAKGRGESDSCPLSLWERVRVREVSSLLLFLLTGLGLAAVQLLPAMEYTRLSVRAAGAYDKMAGGFPVVDVIQMLLPGQVSLYSPLYVGILPLTLAIWAVVTPAARSRQSIFWASVAGVAGLLAFGGNTFLYSPLYLIAPGFSIFRGQERWAFAVAFSLSLLAGYGFKHWLTTPRSPIPFIHHSSFIIHHSSFILFPLFLTLLFFYGLNDTGWGLGSPFYGLLGAATLLTILAWLTWLLWRFAGRLSPAALATLAGGLICLDLFTVNWQTNLYPQLPEWHTQMPAVVAALKADTPPDEPFRVYNEFRLYDNYGVPFALEDLWGASPLRPARYDEFLAPPMPIERAWELLNVKYVITWRKELYLPSTILYAESAGDDTTYVHRLTTPGPRAWVVHRAEVADDAAIRRRIADPNFDRWRVALLEPGAEPFAAALTAPTPTTPAEITRLTHHTPGHLSLDVTTTAPALLLLSETHYPGWQATVDGQPALLLRADYILRAIPLPAGRHTAEVTFQPLSFTLGVAISVMTLGVIAGLGLVRKG
jgi:hypothetical protein